MATTGFLPEKEFLTRMAVTVFNRQYDQTIDWKSFTIRSIAPNYRCELGYEIDSVDYYLRLRFYFNLGDKDLFLPYRLEVDKTVVVDALGDEVYVMLGTVQRYYKEQGIYRFRWIEPDVDAFHYIDDMDGNPLDFVVGGDKLQFMR